MAEARSRREAPPARLRPRCKPDSPQDDGELRSPPPRNEYAAGAAPPALEDFEDEGGGPVGFDEETNSRYEEVKRGSTHISELQHMTMPSLLKIAKDEGLAEYTGLKKQDLIFKIIKERAKQNGLMFGEWTLEVLPDGFGFLRSPDYN